MKEGGIMEVIPFSTYANFSPKTTFSYPVIRTRSFAYEGVKNDGFFEKFAYVLKG